MLGMGLVCRRIDRVTWAAFSAICQTPPRPDGALKLPHRLTNEKIIYDKKATVNDVESIVHISNPLAHLIEQSGGLQGRGTGFHGKFIPASNYRI
jgi:hypothetical protein